jgi:glutamate-1-semialdehyde 2,1-aminomutase
MANGIKLQQHYPDITRSTALYERARALIPGGTQTLAKGQTQYVEGVAPKLLQCGRGARVEDVDGNEYLDFVMALGPISLGYAYEPVDAAIRAQLADGISFSLVHPLEIEVAERIHALVPCAERVRFSKTGADVTSAAVRLARAHTGRRKVLCCGYHGWHDWHIAATSRTAGIPAEIAELTGTFTYNDLDSLRLRIDTDTACVILEPVAFQLPAPGFLAGVRALCDQAGAVLIFDEMWTGFRAALGGAQERFGVTPDLACFSKALANGMPLSVLAGRAEVMAHVEHDIFFYTTFGGETLSLAAAKATLHELERQQVPARLEQLGQRLTAGVTALADRLGLGYARCVGLPCRSLLALDPSGADPLLVKSFVQQELIKRGVLWNGFHALSFSHTETDIDYLLSAYGEVLPLLDRALRAGNLHELIRGRPIQASFRPLPPRPLAASRSQASQSARDTEIES